MQKEEIPIDMIAGTSTKVAIGAIYAQSKDARTVEKNSHWSGLEAANISRRPSIT